MRKHEIILWFFFFSVITGNIVSFSQIARAQESGQEGSLSSGKEIFQQNCAVCHGPKGDGKGMGAEGLIPPPSNFTDPGFWKDKTDSFLAHVISNGIGQMPAWSESLTPTQIRDVLLYIKTFRKD